MKHGALTCLEFMTTAKLPTRYGEFTIVAFCDPDKKEHFAIVKGVVKGRNSVPVRLHSECATGDVLGSLKCDCGPQLHHSMEYIAQQPFGVLLYLRQEGRNIGLVNKIKAYHLQDLGMDTVEANQALGLPDDARDYEFAAEMLKHLGIQSIILLTNNPHKVQDLKSRGITIVKRMPLELPANPLNENYLKVKKKKFGHFLKLNRP